jgi:hypothetical protein
MVARLGRGLGLLIAAAWFGCGNATDTAPANRAGSAGNNGGAAGSPSQGGSAGTSGGGAAGASGAVTAGGAAGVSGAVAAGGAAGGAAGSTASGGAAGAAGASGVGGAMPVDSGGSTTGSLLDRIGVSTVTIAAGVKPGRSNWRIWGTASLNIAPVYTVPLANCGTLVCFTTGTADTRTTPGTSHAYVARLDANDQLVTTHDLGAFECRGLAAEPDGHFAALLWVPGTASDCVDATANGRIYVKRFDKAGAEAWSTELTNLASNPNCPTDWGLGESRMEFGAASYGAYYHVHSQSGHEGDTLKYLDLTGKETTKWAWGCSHSMSNLLRYNPADSAFMPACVTDCYPGTTGSDFATTSIGGVYINNKNKVLSIDAGCNGSVAGELGGAALAPNGWKIVFNAHQAPATLGQSSYSKTTMNQDVAFASIAAGLTSQAVVWLTTTAAINEADSGIERWRPAGDATEQYVVGWAESGAAYKYQLGRVSAAGVLIEGPIDVTARAKWGRRDDPFRAHYNGDVVWAWFDAPLSAALRVARLRSGGSYACATF